MNGCQAQKALLVARRPSSWRNYLVSFGKPLLASRLWNYMRNVCGCVGKSIYVFESLRIGPPFNSASWFTFPPTSHLFRHFTWHFNVRNISFDKSPRLAGQLVKPIFGWQRPMFYVLLMWIQVVSWFCFSLNSFNWPNSSAIPLNYLRTFVAGNLILSRTLSSLNRSLLWQNVASLFYFLGGESMVREEHP